MHENEISYIVRGCIYDIYNNLDPGLFESIYEEILYDELINKGLEVRRQVPIPVV